MIEGKTKSGFEYKIPISSLNDWETLELMSDLDDDDTLIVKIARRIFDKETYEGLKEHCRLDGNVAIDRMVEEIAEVLNSNRDSKNS